MQEIRSNLQFCYLCGRKLRPDSEINLDHIPPQAFFSEAPSENHWRPSVPVHVNCHNQKNQESEQTAILLHKFQTEFDDRVMERNWIKRIAALQLELGSTIDEATWETLYRVKGFNKAYEAVWNWVRGMHAILYGAFLPPLMRHMTHAPFGEMYIPPKAVRGTKHRPVSCHEFQRKKSEAIDVIRIALQTKQFDGIKCWGNRCAFVATWLNRKARSPRCVWALQYDGVTEYGEGTPFKGTPWVGWYDCVRVPANRAILY